MANFLSILCTRIIERSGSNLCTVIIVTVHLEESVLNGGRETFYVLGSTKRDHGEVKVNHGI